MSKKPKRDLAAQLAKAHEDLAGAAAEREGLLARLADGADVGDELTAVEGEIAEHKLMISRLQDAQALASRKQTEEGKAEQHQTTLANLSGAEAEARELAALALDALAKVDELGGLLRNVEGARQKLYASAHVAIDASVAGAGIPVERASTSAYDRLRRITEQLTQSSAFTQRLHANGIGTRGITASRDHVIVLPLRGHFEPERDVDEAITSVQNFLADLAGWSAAANGITPTQENAA